MHLVQPWVARLSADRRHEAIGALAAVLPRLNSALETSVAYVAICALWGFVLYLILMAIGS